MDFNEPQLSNIESISFTLDVFNPDKSIFSSTLHPLNIFFIDTTSDVSTAIFGIVVN